MSVSREASISYPLGLRLSLSLGIVSSVLILLLLSSMFRRFALHGLLDGEFA